MATLEKTAIKSVYIHRSKNECLTYYGRVGRDLLRLCNNTNGETLEDAARILKTLKVEQNRKKGGVPSLNEVFASFAGGVSEQIKPSKNHIDYMARYEMHIRDRFGSLGLDEITPKMMEDFHTEIASTKSEASAYHILNVIRYLYSHAYATNTFYGRKPFGKSVGFTLRVPRRRRESIYDPSEVNEILRELKKECPTTYAMTKLSFLTGMRFGEVVNLKGMHVDLKRMIFKLVDTKSGYDRSIPIPEAVVDILRERMSGNPQDHIFTNNKGEPVRYLSRKFEKVLKKLEVNKDITDSRFRRKFHTLRHSYATVMLDEKVLELKDLQAMLGHENITTTQRYLHANKEAMRKGATAASRLLSE